MRWLVVFLIVVGVLAMSQGENWVSVFNPKNPMKPFVPSTVEVQRLRTLVEPSVRRQAMPDQISCDSDRLEVRDYADGAFTRRGAKQRAYIYLYCSAASTFRYSGLAVFENNRPVLNMVFPGQPFFIKALPDINRNGVSELLLHNGMIRMGSENFTVTILDLARGRVNNLGSFDVLEGNCTGVREPFKFTEWHIFARPGTRPIFWADVYSSGCSANPPLTRRKVPIRPAEYGGIREIRVLN